MSSYYESVKDFCCKNLDCSDCPFVDSNVLCCIARVHDEERFICIVNTASVVIEEIKEVKEKFPDFK